MGSYAHLLVNGVEISWSKNEPDPTALIVFREGDRFLHPETLQTDNAFEDWLAQSSGGGDDDEYPADFQYRYQAPAAVVKDRLEVLGVTLSGTAEHFEEARAEQIELLADFNARFASPADSTAAENASTELETARALSLEAWLAGMMEIFEHDLHRQEAADEGQRRVSPLVAYMLDHKSRQFGFPGYDSRFFLRAVLEACPADATVTYDLHDLLGGGYISVEENLTEWAHQHLADEFSLSQKIVVLTEGRSDKWILEKALRLLYPHLADYYSFMDFEGTHLPGGAGHLVAIVKAFVGAGIANRTLALFDNDTAAQSALRALGPVSLPKHIQVLRYPDIGIARAYPTLGPTGIVTMDINGLAASVEVYLGDDTLRDDAGNLVPVQWRGYDDGLKQYQGEILNKTGIQERFRDKLKDCEADPSRIPEYDWSGIRAILDVMRTAFH